MRFQWRLWLGGLYSFLLFLRIWNTNLFFISLPQMCQGLCQKTIYSRGTLVSNVKFAQYLTVLNFISSSLTLPVFCFTDNSKHWLSHLPKTLPCLFSLQRERANYIPLPKLSPRITSAQSNALCPLKLHLVHFSSSINKCFHLHSFLFHVHIEHTWIMEDDVLQSFAGHSESTAPNVYFMRH